MIDCVPNSYVLISFNIVLSQDPVLKLASSEKVDTPIIFHLPAW